LRRGASPARELEDDFGRAHEAELVARDALDGDRVLAKMTHFAPQMLDLLPQLRVLDSTWASSLESDRTAAADPSGASIITGLQ
jgi:hypothetical protein